jgi:hypothetical protein
MEDGLARWRERYGEGASADAASLGVLVDVLEPEQWFGPIEVLPMVSRRWHEDPVWAEALSPAAMARRRLDDAEDLPVGERFIRLMFQVDPDDLDEVGLLRYAKAWKRVENAAHGRTLDAVGRFAGVQRDPEAPDEQPDFRDCEVAVALNVSTPVALRLMDKARALSQRLPGTLAAAVAGDLGFAHLLRMVDATDELTAKQAARVEALVLPRAPRQSPGLFGQAVRRAVARVDATKLQTRHRNVNRSTDVDVTFNMGRAHLEGCSKPSMAASSRSPSSGGRGLARPPAIRARWESCGRLRCRPSPRPTSRARSHPTTRQPRTAAR